MMEANRQLVSVCIPVFNGEKYLKETLDSVVNQTYKELEIIIVDDGSTDSSHEIVSQYQQIDPRISFHKNAENLGLVQNWNRCLEVANGDWIKFQFQDDIMTSETIERMVEFALEHNQRLVLTDRNYIAEASAGKKKALRRYAKVSRLSDYVTESRAIAPEEMVKIANDDLFKHNFLGEPILGLISKDLVSTYGGFDTMMAQIVDFEFWLRISLNESIGFINEPLHTFRIHGASQTVKNKKAKGVNPSWKDRVYLTDKFLEDTHYQFYREETDRTVEGGHIQALKNQMIRLATVCGHRTFKKAFGQERIDWMEWDPGTKFWPPSKLWK